MEYWFVFSVISLFFFGLWGFLPKLTSGYLGIESILLYQTLGAALFSVLMLFVMNFRPEIHFKGMMLSVLTGVAGLLGTLAFLLAISKGKVSVVVTVTALYPLVVIAFSSLFFQETINFKQGVGIFFALISILFLSS